VYGILFALEGGVDGAFTINHSSYEDTLQIFHDSLSPAGKGAGGLEVILNAGGPGTKVSGKSTDDNKVDPVFSENFEKVVEPSSRVFFLHRLVPILGPRHLGDAPTDPRGIFPG